MHYQPNTPITEGVFAWGFTINNLLEISDDKMHNDVHLKLKRQHACTKPNTPSSNPLNILNENNNNIYGHGANKRQLKGHLYYLIQKY